MAFVAPAIMGALALYKAYQDSQSSSDAQNRVNAASAQQLHNTDTAWRTIQLKRQEDANAMMGNLSRQMNSYGGAASVLSNMYGGQGSAPVGTGLPPPMLQGLRGPIGGPTMGPRGATPGVNMGGGPAIGGMPQPPMMGPSGGIPGLGSMGGGPAIGALPPPPLPGGLGGLSMGGGPAPTNQLGLGMAARPPMGMGGPSSTGLQSLASLLGPGAFGGLTGGPRPLGG